MMEGVKIKKLNVTRAAALHVIETVLGAGVTYGLGYWGEVKRVERRGLGPVTAFVVTEHEAYDAKTPARTVRVTVAMIGPAIATLMNQSDGGFVRRIAADEVDGPLCDAIVQVACFGEVIYG